MVTNDMIKLNVIINLDINTEAKNQLFHDNIKTLKSKQIRRLIQTMKKFSSFSFYYLKVT